MTANAALIKRPGKPAEIDVPLVAPVKARLHRAPLVLHEPLTPALE